MSADKKTSMLLQGLATGIDEVLKDATGERIGFCLVTFPLNREGAVNYIGNADRQDIAKMLRGLLERWQGGMPDVPLHKKQ